MDENESEYLQCKVRVFTIGLLSVVSELRRRLVCVFFKIGMK